MPSHTNAAPTARLSLLSQPYQRLTVGDLRRFLSSVPREADDVDVEFISDADYLLALEQGHSDVPAEGVIGLHVYLNTADRVS